MPTIDDPNTQPTGVPLVVEAGQSFDPFTAIIVSGDPVVSPPIFEAVYVDLTSNGTNPGTLTDPVAKPVIGPENPFYESGDIVGSPSPGTTILNRLVYAAPSLSNGVSEQTTANIEVYDQSAYYPYYYPYYYYSWATDNPTIDVITPPAISGTVANQPGSANPFGQVLITDTDFNGAAKDSATITVTYNGGAATDTVGTLAGNGFLSYSGPGTYTIGATSPANLSTELHEVTLATPSFFGNSRIVSLKLDVTDVLPTNGVTLAPGLNNLTTTDTTTSVIETGTATVTLAGTAQQGQVLTATSDDPSANFQWQNSPDGTTWTDISGATAATHTIAPADENDMLRVVASDTYGSGDSLPSERVTARGTDVTYDNTTGQWAHVTAKPYVGPTNGLTSEFITTSPDNLDIWSTTPNQFIKAAGNDAINDSYGGGNNVLDGGEGSNFLMSGGGHDTFYVEDLSNKQPTWNTLINFVQGDNATIWGISPADFNLSWGDNAGNSIYKGLTLYATSATRPEAAVTIAGLSTADLGRDLKVAFGNVAGYNYMELSHV